MSKCPIMTTEAGAPVPDNQNSLTAGPRGPLLIDPFLIESMAHFNRERVPERVVHAKGAGAHGTFTVTADLAAYTSADLFSKVGNHCDVFLRFSTVAGEQGSADTVGDPRGFSCKFYTKEGNWDMVGNNTPVFFLRDPMKFRDFIHSQKRCPQSGMRDTTMQWDYLSQSPESLHQVTILFSDRGIPATYRHMDGFSSHTYSLWNKKGERFWVKWHFKTMQGIKCFTDEEAQKIAGQDFDYHRRDLFSSIEKKEYPKWQVQIQIMPELEADSYSINPFDLTKVWPHKDYPLKKVGILELNRNPSNYFAEVEQAAFEPNNVPPFMGFSPDKVLQARVLSYSDAHRHRIGTNYSQLPINKPSCPVHTYNRDGHMRFDGNYGNAVNYQPNSYQGPIENKAVTEPPLRISGAAFRYDQQEGSDDYTQAGHLFQLMNSEQKKQLVDNIVRSMRTVPKAIQLRQIEHFSKASAEYGQLVAKGLEISMK